MSPYLLPILLIFISPPLLVNRGTKITTLRPVQQASVLQYWNTRCTKSVDLTELPDTIHLFPGLPIVDIYLQVEDEIYFLDQLHQEAIPTKWFQDLILMDHYAETEWDRVFYIVAPDETNPGAAKLCLTTGIMEVRTNCSTHLPILAPFKREKRLSIVHR